jgi:predicted nucleic acid-binding protein
MYLVDTNVVSELRRPERADTNVVAWASTVPAASFFLSVISILEIELGALQIARRDAAQGAVLREWIDDQILPRFDGRILAIDTAVAQRCAHLHVPDPCAERDALIAATALVHGLTVVTRNVADFERAALRCSIRGIPRAPARRSEDRRAQSPYCS